MRILQILNPAAAFLIHDMNPAFVLGGPSPTAGTLVLAVQDCPRARPATDARVSLIVKRIIRNVVLGDERPHIAFRPTQKRIHFGQIEFSIPLDYIGFSAIGGLIAADSTDPGLIPRDRAP